MDNKLYKMMNWPEIEDIIYSECDHPHELLGRHFCQAGSLIQAFFPGASGVTVRSIGNGQKFPMEEADENGYFALWTPDKNLTDYEYLVEYPDGRTKISPECYGAPCKPDKAFLDKFNSGVNYDMYEFFGAHETEIKGQRGISFSVYAPNAERVSVVGDFNAWDGRENQMSRVSENGIFSIFIPGLEPGSLYKYEIKLKHGLTFLKRDPFSFSMEKGRGFASRVICDDSCHWSDSKYMTTFKGISAREIPLVLGELSLSEIYEEGLSDKAFADRVVTLVRDKRFNAVTIEDLSVFGEKENCPGGIQCIYAVNDEQFSIGAAKKVINALHEANIPVFLKLDLSSFLPDNEGLIGFDGSKLYEADDDRKVEERINFRMMSPYVRNYLISAAFYYGKVFHADGFVLANTDRILYLDYGRKEGDFAPNMYGGVENLQGEELIKHLNSILHKKNAEIVTIAADSQYSNNLTKYLDEDGLGFDYKISMNFYKSLMDYMNNEPFTRSAHHAELTNMSLNAYCEEFILSLPRKDVGSDEFRLCEFMAGDYEDKIREIKLALSTLFFMPDKKSHPFTDLKDAGLDELAKALSELYFTESALHELDDSAEGFTWLDAIDSEHSTIAYMRKGKKDEILVLSNFSDQPTTVTLKLPELYHFAEVLDTEEVRFGGSYSLKEQPLRTVYNRSTKKRILTVEMAPLSTRALKRIL